MQYSINKEKIKTTLCCLKAQIACIGGTQEQSSPRKTTHVHYDLCLLCSGG